MKRISQLFKRIFISILASASLLFISSCSSNDKKVEPNLDVVIEVKCDEHVRTTSNNPQIVKKGEDAKFALVVDDDYRFYSSSDGSFDENSSILSIGSDNGNKTVDVRSINTSGFILNVYGEDGVLKIEPEKEFYSPGEEVTLETISSNKEFLCYTYDIIYRNGQFGITGVPFSFDRKTTINIEKDTTVYVNYFADNSKIIDYDLNGGHTVEGNDLIHTDYVHYSNQDYLFSNTINLSNYARRDGYLLESLNTKKDGTGTRIGIGSRINNQLFKNNKITLFAQWILCSEESNFVTNDVNENEVEIISSSNINNQVLAVPSSINNKRVIGIKANAFNEVSSVVDLYLPDTLKYVEDGAFIGMSSLKNLHLFSSVSRVSKESFDAPNLESLYLNKNTYPLDKDVANDILSAYKEAVLKLDKTKSSVIVIGHSTTRINHDLSPLKEAYGTKYNFFIYGAVAGIDGYLLTTSLMDALKENDYIILPMWPLLEDNTIGPRNISFIQYNFDCLLNAEYSYLKGFIWESLIKYRELCTDQIGVSAYQVESHNYSEFNETGGVKQGEESDDPNNGSGQNFDSYLKNPDISRYNYLHRVFEKMDIQSGHILLTWNPYNQNCLTDYSLCEQYEQLIRNEFNECSYFDSQMDNLYPGNYFLKNDFSHLSTLGGQKRIERWVSQLNPYFAI